MGTDFYEEWRTQVVGRLDEIVEEWQFEQLLTEIVSAAEVDLESTAEDFSAGLEAVEAWASLASYATGRFYTLDGRDDVGRRTSEPPAPDCLVALTPSWSTL